MIYSKILVTGGAGFIGSRLCEKFTLEYDQPCRALVRNFSKAARIARLGTEMVAGDLTNPADLDRALSGCDAVVHLAFGGAKTAEKNLLGVCKKRKIKRLVHISSMAVHGPAPGPGCASEETAVIGRYGERYSDDKVRAEILVGKAIARGLPGVILRPTVVYGPYSPFVMDVIQAARTGTVTLIDAGSGICNAVYVDDVCDAILAALHSEGALGKAFFVNADRAVAWQEFNMTFGGMVTPPPQYRDVSAAAVRAYWASKGPSLRSNLRSLRRLLTSSEFHEQLSTVPALRSSIVWSKTHLKRVLTPDQVVALKRAPGDSNSGVKAAEWPSAGRLVREDFHLEFSNARARRELKWKPAFDFQAGAALTRTWLEAAGMLGSEG